MLDEILSPLRWRGGVLELLDQRKLPTEEVWITCRDYRQAAQAIREMVVRGAPAIGCAAAYGVVLGARQGVSLLEVNATLRETRPTAVNLFWALERMAQVSPSTPEALEREAIQIHQEDIASCIAIGNHGAPLMPRGGTILTHCNAGALATGGYGTALGVIRSAHKAGRNIRVFADETRPWLQGARLTAWELQKSGIDVTVIADNMAGHLMRKGEIQAVIVGADRIASNGDTANKIGTYSVAVLAHEHRIPFYVAAPLSTIDLKVPNGAYIPIEERSHEEVTTFAGVKTAPDGVPARHPAFDVTPSRLITAIITEAGICRPNYVESLRRLFVTGESGAVMASDSSEKEHRQHLRVPVALKVSYLSKGDLARDLVVNLSPGGLFIRTGKPLTIGTDVDLEVLIGDEDPPLHVRGQVVWLNDANQQEGMGIRFTGALGPLLLQMVEQLKVAEANPKPHSDDKTDPKKA